MDKRKQNSELLKELSKKEELNLKTDNELNLLEVNFKER